MTLVGVFAYANIQRLSSSVSSRSQNETGSFSWERVRVLMFHQENQGNVAIIKSVWPCAPSVLGQWLNSTTTWVTVGLWCPGIDIGRFSLQVCKAVVRPCCLQGTVWYLTSRSWRRSVIFYNQCVSTFYFFILESLPQLLIHPDNPWTAKAASSL